MEHEKFPAKSVYRPPLRTFRVTLFDTSVVVVQAHLVFNNANDKNDERDSLLFRKYYDNDTRTEVVAEFQKNAWLYYNEENPA